MVVTVDQEVYEVSVVLMAIRRDQMQEDVLNWKVRRAAARLHALALRSSRNVPIPERQCVGTTRSLSAAHGGGLREALQGDLNALWAGRNVYEGCSRP